MGNLSDNQSTAKIFEALAEANNSLNGLCYGESTRPQPIHTLYGGAHLFRAGANHKLGRRALGLLDQYAPDAASFAAALDLKDSGNLAGEVYSRMRHKLETQPVEDWRIDFEDGYGNRSDEEEDAHAKGAAEQLAQAMEEGTLPPFVGIRIKSFMEPSCKRAVRTLELFLTALAEKTDGQLPGNFMVTLPKVSVVGHVKALADLLDLLETKHGFAKGSIGIDLMIETPQAIIGNEGQCPMQQFVHAGNGRVVSVSFGTFDFTAALGIIAPHQLHTHSSADFARFFMQCALAGTGVTISDGITNRMPVGPHKLAPDQKLTTKQLEENRGAVHAAWRVHFQNIGHSLKNGIYQGWDLHPGQLPVRYAAVYQFFLENLADSTARLKGFVGKAAQASLVGSTFDDEASGQGLLNFFLRGLSCGALQKSEVLATGITMEELASRDFLQIVKNRS